MKSRRRSWRCTGWNAAAGCLLVLALPTAVCGQIRLGLRTEHQDLLQFEAIRVFITVYNDTGEELQIGGTNAAALDVRMFVEDSFGLPQSRRRDEPLCRSGMILPETSRAFLRDISAWFRMIETKRYRLLVEGRRRGKLYKSNSVMINVIPGLVLSETEKVLDGYDDRIRRYGLRYWRRDRREHLFLRVDEITQGASMNYGTIDLGPVIRFVDPELTVARDGKVEIMHQSGRACHTRTVFQSDPDRLRFLDRTYHLPNGDPYPNIRGRRKAGPAVPASTNAPPGANDD